MTESIKYLIEEDICVFRTDYRELSKLKKMYIWFRSFIIAKQFRAIFLYRIAHFLQRNHKYSFLFIEALRKFLSPIEIDAKTVIGPRFNIPHPFCIIIGGGTIGKSVTIYQGVTIGVKSKEDANFATIGDHVILSAGSKILGERVIGDNSQIGANAVVIEDIPKNSIAVGVPAKVIKKRFMEN